MYDAKIVSLLSTLFGMSFFLTSGAVWVGGVTSLSTDFGSHGF